MLILISTYYKALLSQGWMQNFSKHIKKIILVFVAMQILNTGLFAQDFPTATNGQNVINSITEYVAEILLNKGDVFPEYHQHHQKHNKHSHSFLFKVQQYILFKHTAHNTSFAFKEQNLENKYVLENYIRLQEVIFDITPPPPKV